MRAIGPFLLDAWRLARPYFRSEERWSARVLLAAIIALNLATVGLSVLFNFWNRAFYDSLQDKDWNSFISLVLTYKHMPSGPMPGFCAIAAVYILVAVYRTYLNQWLQIRWRRWMTTQFLDAWLAGRAYYRIGLNAAATTKDGIGSDNPDQRIAEDVRDFVSNTLSLGLDLMSNVVTLASFISILWSLSGAMTVFGVAIPGYMVWVALAYAVVGTWVTHLVGRPLGMLRFRQQRVEADFRFALVRLRENAEGVALYGGEAEENHTLAARFAALIANWWGIMQRTKALNALVASYSQIAVVFPIVVAAPRYFSGAMALGGLMQTLDAFGQVQGAMSWFVNVYADLAVWRAVVERLATFRRLIDEAHTATTGLASEPGADDFVLDDVTLALPGGQHLVEHASLTFRRGESVIVTGRSGSGKSTLFRALAGIWPFGSGTVRRPAGRVLFLPQRPYLPLGTLRHAVCYPADTADLTDDAVRAALDAAGIAHLAPRLDEDDNWTQRLSGGEQQRVALARALLVQPDWLFLDEATASLDPEAEEALYAVLRERLPACTIVSVAHRPTVAAHHARHLVLQRATDAPGQFVETAAVAGAAGD
jgi:putative ATP-binding cassette transporter